MKIPNLVKNRKHQWIKKGYVQKRQVSLELKQFIPISVDENGVLEVFKLFDKLKTYVTFS